MSPSHLWKKVGDLAVGVLRRIYLRHAFQELRVFKERDVEGCIKIPLDGVMEGASEGLGACESM